MNDEAYNKSCQIIILYIFTPCNGNIYKVGEVIALRVILCLNVYEN